MATKRGREERLRNEDEDHGVELDVESKKSREVEKAESVGRRAPTEKAVSESPLSFGNTAMQLVNKETRKKVKNVIYLVSSVNFDAENLRWLVNGVDDWKRLSEQSRHEKLASELCAKEIVRTRSGSSS